MAKVGSRLLKFWDSQSVPSARMEQTNKTLEFGTDGHCRNVVIQPLTYAA